MTRVAARVAELRDKNEWFRVGRGRYREYESISPRDIGAILERLPADYAPYRIFASEMVQVGKCGYEDVCRAIDSDEIQSYVDRGVWDFYIVSARLSPWAGAGVCTCDSDNLAVNGAVGLQFNSTGQHGTDTTVIGHTNHVCSEKTGEHVRFPEYSRVFEAAIRAATRLEKERR